MTWLRDLLLASILFQSRERKKKRKKEKKKKIHTVSHTRQNRTTN